MNRAFISLIFFLSVINPAFAQIFYNAKIDSVVNRVSSVSLVRTVRELSGDTTANVNGTNVLIRNRQYNFYGNILAAQYVFEKFQSFGLAVSYQYNNASCVNVLAKKTGTKYPGKQLLIFAHYDSYCNLDTVAPGADDNASGISGVMEIARLISGMDLDYTVLFIAFDEEERGLYGSYAYADTAYARGDTIVKFLNLDMIAYDTTGCFSADGLNSRDPYLDFLDANFIYNSGLRVVSGISGSSDYYPFYKKGYLGAAVSDFDWYQYIHTPFDTFDKLNTAYFTKAVKLCLAAFLSWNMSFVELKHNRLQSTTDSSSRTAVLALRTPLKLASGTASPRLYYKFDGGNYYYTNAFYSSADTLKFTIPGHTAPAKVSYYFAVQDSASTGCTTLPRGGSGINPPGTVPVDTPYVYYILSTQYGCSVTTPKTINDLQLAYDTVNITQPGIVDYLKINLTINHPDDGELFIVLRNMNSRQSILCSYNGSGGANYINTIFEDSASVSISQGTPPFTGSYRPVSPLSDFKNQSLAQKWILRIYDNKSGNTGTLINWCILFRYYNSIFVNENTEPVSYSLEQNYPNPFNPVTNIKFSLAKKESVTLKVYDALGRESCLLVNGILEPGSYIASWNASGYSSGVYYYVLKTDKFCETRRMILLK